QNNSNTINNIRLWNQGPLKDTFSQLQEIRLYYEFSNIDVDRYTINGNLEQVMLSPREMDISKFTSLAQTWINQHLVYTHGYGVVMSPVSRVTSEGLPHFYIKDFPPNSSIDLKITQPEVYYGEKIKDYLIVNTDESEFDYPKGEDNMYTHYAGAGGIQLDSLFKKFVYALKFSELKILISPQIKKKSRILYDHDIRNIVSTIAPFLVFDQDPYLVISPEGRMVWMLDAYTLSGNFPYSQPYRRGVNYIRNSVKATIDAYSGETQFYIVDPKDPLIQTYSKIYGHLFKPFDQMPAGLQAHIRYPKDLFHVQANLYSTYHMTNPQVFYNKEDLWNIPSEIYGESEQRMNAYYMVTKLPDDEADSFILMLPFTPTNKNNMIGWMGAKCDLNEYGKLTVFKFPKDRTIYGPMQIESRIDQDTDISQKLTLWGQMGSRVIRGNLMVVPIEQSLIYVEPIYLQATSSKLPELKRVIFAYNNQIEMKENLYTAISSVFDGAQFESSEDDTNKLSSSSKPTGSLKAIVHTLRQHFNAFKQAAKSNDWALFGKKLGQVDDSIKKLIRVTESN
ncbi:MAG: UPF0182 family protein, partial [Candidatus Margulisbacteria bacterium]|nr:UPF0182 family protein [Candidatus Margulisiibacteriota bacterium]